MDYAEVARTEGIEWCDGTDDGEISAKRHEYGYAQPSVGIVHWSDRRVSKAGLRHFLMLVGAVRFRHNRGQPTWLKLYEANTYAQETALKVYHRQLPRHLSETDRARVRHLLARDGVLDKPEWKHIRAWSMNRGGQ